MGYTVQPSSNVFEHYSPVNSSITGTTVATNISLTPFSSLPGLKGNLLSAFMDLYVPNVRNGAVVSNHIDAGTLQVQDTGATWRDVLVIPANSLWIEGDDTQYTGLCLRGFTDIKDYLDLSTVTNIRIEDFTVDQNNLYWYAVFCGLRLYYE